MASNPAPTVVQLNSIIGPTDDWMMLLICISYQYSTTEQAYFDPITPLSPSSAVLKRATSQARHFLASVMRHHLMHRAAQN